MNRKSELFLIVPHSGGVKLSPEDKGARSYRVSRGESDRGGRGTHGAIVLELDEVVWLMRERDSEDERELQRLVAECGYRFVDAATFPGLWDRGWIDKDGYLTAEGRKGARTRVRLERSFITLADTHRHRHG